MNRPPCFGRTPLGQNGCVECAYLPGCIDKEKMMASTSPVYHCICGGKFYDRGAYLRHPCDSVDAMSREEREAFILKAYHSISDQMGVPVEPKTIGTKLDKEKMMSHDKAIETANHIREWVRDTQPVGTKADKGKPRWSLLPIGVMRDIIAVLEHGAVKYAVNNWMHVEEPGRRYYDAAMRHIDARADGEKNDPDSGLPHLAHAVCCLMFLMWFEARGKC